MGTKLAGRADVVGSLGTLWVTMMPMVVRRGMRKPLDRRDFLGRSLAAGSGLLFACSDNRVPMSTMGPVDAGMIDTGLADVGLIDAGMVDAGMVPACADPFMGGDALGRLSFLREEGATLDELVNQGWDGRLYSDLSNIDADNLTIDNDRFFVRTRYPDLLQPPDAWTIDVGGLATSTTLFLDDLLPLVRPMGTYVLECSGNSRGRAFGLMGAASWGGIPFDEVLGHVAIDPRATRVLVSGFDEHSVPSANNHSTPGASWIFSFEDLANSGAFLATEMNGEPLPLNHGAPVRLYVPNWYGCSCIKWVNAIELVDDSAPATSQMLEFASRTLQDGRPPLARDFLPAAMDQAAMPIRVEKWRVDGQLVYRIVGIMWGGYELTDQLAIRFNGSAPEPVEVCPVQENNDTWTLWSYAWQPPSVGNYAVRMQIDDPSIVTRRLDTGYYERSILVDEV